MVLVLFPVEGEQSLIASALEHILLLSLILAQFLPFQQIINHQHHKYKLSQGFLLAGQDLGVEPLALQQVGQDEEVAVVGETEAGH